MNSAFQNKWEKRKKIKENRNYAKLVFDKIVFIFLV